MRRLYRLSLLILPRWFRAKHGGQMEELFAKELQRPENSGRLNSVKIGLLGIGDVVTQGMKARWRGTQDHHRTNREWRMGTVGHLLQDLRFAARSVVRAPRFSTLAIAILALGIGADTAVFSVVNQVVLRPLPFPDADRFAELAWQREQGSTMSATAWEFEYWGRNATSFAAIATYRGLDARIGDSGDEQGVRALRVTDEFLEALGIPPARGRNFAPDDMSEGAADVVLISDPLWRSRFGADPTLLGSTVRVSGSPHSVIGVLPPDWSFPQSPDAQILLPLRLTPVPQDEGRNFPLIARLADGVTRDDAAAELSRIFETYRTEYSEVVYDDDRGLRIASFQELHAGGLPSTLWVLLGASAFVLLVACANVANLLLARALERRREITLRSVLGASRKRVIGQVVCEAVILSLVAGGVGLLLARGGIEALLALYPERIPGVGDVEIDLNVLLFCAGASLVTGIVFGFATAVPATRAGMLGSVDRQVRGSRKDGFALDAMIGAETALSTTLLVGAGLLISTFVALNSVDPGFEADGVVTFRFPWPPEGYGPSLASTADQSQLAEIGGRSATARQSLIRTVASELESVIGVQSHTWASVTPLERGLNIPVTVEGSPDAFEGAIEWRAITPGYFETLGVPVVRGRDISDADDEASPRVVLINQAYAERYFPEGDAIGKRLEIGRFRGNWIAPFFEEAGAAEIVGIVSDVLETSLSQEQARRTVFVPQAQAVTELLSTPVLMVRTARPDLAVEGVRAAFERHDPGLPAPVVRTLEEQVSSSVAGERFNAFLMATFAAIALALTVFGVFAVVSYTVRRRAREIGIRLALGAEEDQLIRRTVGRGLRPIVLGLVLGIGGAVILGRLLAGMLWSVESTDLPTIAAVAALLLLTSLVSTWLPARRLARIDPLRSLRAE